LGETKHAATLGCWQKDAVESGNGFRRIAISSDAK
jgi:hypothetical protein